MILDVIYNDVQSFNKVMMMQGILLLLILIKVNVVKMQRTLIIIQLAFVGEKVRVAATTKAPQDIASRPQPSSIGHGKLS